MLSLLNARLERFYFEDTYYLVIGESLKQGGEGTGGPDPPPPEITSYMGFYRE